MNNIDNENNGTPQSVNQEKPKWKDTIDYWLNKIEIIAKISLPVVLLFLGNQLNESYRAKEQQLKQVELNQNFIQKQVELNQKYIEIAVGILNSKPTAETTPLRDWAIDVIDKYSEIKLTKEAKKLLKEKPLPKEVSVSVPDASSIFAPKGSFPEGYWPKLPTAK